jgi:short subunit fatty acids transporter
MKERVSNIAGIIFQFPFYAIVGATLTVFFGLA